MMATLINKVHLTAFVASSCVTCFAQLYPYPAIHLQHLPNPVLPPHLLMPLIAPLRPPSPPPPPAMRSYYDFQGCACSDGYEMKTTDRTAPNGVLYRTCHKPPGRPFDQGLTALIVVAGPWFPYLFPYYVSILCFHTISSFLFLSCLSFLIYFQHRHSLALSPPSGCCSTHAP